ncbi:DUF3291 domain-containing protein [Streptomyces roseirectus]|uniref:DUF3291 domain-containing protein n=1 Tax=Streptomyces roseirectus TaxID=2768066 RepID=A0A7H0I7N8_9ACTN|nr:DUF3291 domain-containing protein [Streptomyces roseirectus]QNP68804.1 DUF3291 domain-containing protein [Streptomyces roseirectus]
MPALSWTAATPPPPDTEAYLMASRFEVRTLADALRFLLKTPAVWKQAKGAPGAYGAALIAEPLKRTFWTLSSWESEDALHAYARAVPHRPVMTGLRKSMKSATFTYWAGPPAIDWTDARNRLAEKQREDAS